ncbi:MAG: YHYH protein [Saprospiraceae bacterium]
MRILGFIMIMFLLISCGTSTSNTNEALTSKNATTDFATIDFSKAFVYKNSTYGTQTNVVFKDGNRVMKTNALPNHSTGEFPRKGNPNTISAQDITYRIPLNPKLSGEPKWAREPGVALNGVKFEPETAERFVCETGEVYKIEAFQELVNLGLDYNHAHVQPTGAYHYHGVPTELVKLLDKGEDLILIGYAKDGFPMYYSKSGQYKPSYKLSEELRTGDACSYKNPRQGMDKELNNTQPDGTFVSDWEYVNGLGELDECNGMEINGQYAYFVTDEYPYVSRCLKGVFTEKRPKGPPPGGQHRHGNGRPHRH